MDSPLASKVFQRLLSHQTCSRLRFYPPTSGRLHSNSLGRRHYRRSQDNDEDDRQTSSWQMRTDMFPPDKLKEYERYPLVTSEMLRNRRERPKRVKMLARDFIDDSLYNPHYGYFPKQAVIFNPGRPFDFNDMANEPEFHKELGRRYTAFEDELDGDMPNESRQLWHTPSELFRPHYGEAIARYMVQNYKYIHFPLHDLIIYELGAGNGTLMLNILDYIRDLEPDVYDKTKFKIIEISSSLASLQSKRLMRTASSRGHAERVEIINKSIFSWDTYVTSHCFFLALEVFDNFAHDSIRYDPFTEQPLQGSVLIDNSGDFYEFYTEHIDPEAMRFLEVRDTACSSESFDHPLKGSRFLRRLRSKLPFAPNLTPPEWIPTRLMQFFNVLAEYFPRHRLVASDFHFLPNAIKGYNAPAVQTRYQRRTVPASTPYVLQGYFDIIFPTDFGAVQDIYSAITGNLTKVMSHSRFLTAWSYPEDTETKSRENPMLSWYKNSTVLISTT